MIHKSQEISLFKRPIYGLVHVIAYAQTPPLNTHVHASGGSVDLKITPSRRQSKTSILLTNVDQQSFETEFSIVICRPTGDT